MTSREFCALIEALTGSQIKVAVDSASLDQILADDALTLDFCQLNELLLLVGKNRVEEPFFNVFFSPCTVGSLSASVERFQKTALLLYGNFIFAYRTLSRITERGRLESKLDNIMCDPNVIEQQFRGRAGKIIDIDLLPEKLTPFVGYVSGPRLTGEYKRSKDLQDVLSSRQHTSWEDLIEEVDTQKKDRELPELQKIIGKYRTTDSSHTVETFRNFIAESTAKLDELRQEADRAQARATRNQNTYLTWDLMDVYFATSMRETWEYFGLYRFINDLMKSDFLSDLNLRYFDPTQSFTKNRINKGLVEALMLKRAQCTVYSIQDNDTLGKDSELASTLAQGKPVIAYVEHVDVEKREAELYCGDLAMLRGRLNIILSAGEVRDRMTPEVQETAGDVHAFVVEQIWQGLPDSERDEAYRKTHSASLRALCHFVATEEARLYDKRADLLKGKHPLAIQVNLDTGVANGLLVVREVSKCAELLRRILLKSMEFDLVEDDDAWTLNERISGSIFRVVTKDQTLSNSFWNFYLRNSPNPKGN